jgi:hypothetical protein
MANRSRNLQVERKNGEQGKRDRAGEERINREDIYLT